MTSDFDLIADLNAHDDDGLGWSIPDHDCAPGRIVAVDDDDRSASPSLPGSVAKNRHLLGRTVA